MRGSIRGESRAPISAPVAMVGPSSLPPPCGLRAAGFTLGEAEYLVLSYPAAPPALPGSLTASERGVASSLLAGLSNRQIAVSRGVAVRTVANQVASVLRKAGVRSRFELARKYAV